MNTNVLILSDTHGGHSLVDEVLGKCRPDLLLYCGDGLRDLTYSTIPCPLYAVRGNCDWSIPVLDCVGGDAPEEQVVPVGDFRVLLMHGHLYHVKGGLTYAIRRAVEVGADALVFGHTHLPLDMTIRPGDNSPWSHMVQKDLHVFNPGSLRESPHTFGVPTLRGGVPLFSHGQLET